MKVEVIAQEIQPVGTLQLNQD
ncbi:hypothetical protein VIBNIPon4_490056 [Vibrio nigripulchritudo POn4]|nr:hypothetical protein VIBNIPon4_490056 [Vibrio nigripulchritudo POn4]